MPSLKDVWVIIPAFNEEKTITQVIVDLRNVGLANIIVVDDGSTDETAKLAEGCGVVVLKHLVNRGVGAATITGFEYCKARKAFAVLIVDGDGQHLAEDAFKVVQPVLKAEADVSLGTRIKDPKKFPWNRLFLNIAANILTFVLFGLWVSDSQCGLRCFNAKALSEMKLQGRGWSISSEMIGELKRAKLSFKEVPIEPVYTNYSLNKGQKGSNALRLIRELFLLRLGV